MRPHQNLIVWQQAIELVKKIYIITRDFPESEKFGIVSQIRRASVSVACNIAEGAVRSNKKDFARFLNISSGSLSEVDTLLIISRELGFLKTNDFEQLNSLGEKVFALLNGLNKSISRSDEVTK